MGSRKDELTISEVVRVIKDKEGLKTEVITYLNSFTLTHIF